MKDSCFLLITCKANHSHGLEHGVFLDEVEAVAEMWQLASVASRARGIPISNHSRHSVLVGDTCVLVREVRFFG